MLQYLLRFLSIPNADALGAAENFRGYLQIDQTRKKN